MIKNLLANSGASGLVSDAGISHLLQSLTDSPKMEFLCFKHQELSIYK